MKYIAFLFVLLLQSAFASTVYVNNLHATLPLLVQPYLDGVPQFLVPPKETGSYFIGRETGNVTFNCYFVTANATYSSVCTVDQNPSAYGYANISLCDAGAVIYDAGGPTPALAAIDFRARSSQVDNQITYPVTQHFFYGFTFMWGIIVFGWAIRMMRATVGHSQDV